MRRILPLLLLPVLLLPALPAFAQASPAARVTQVDTTHYPDVTLYVSVTGVDGQPVGGLASRDFTVTEDGQPVTIGDFAGAAGPVTTMLVIDRSGSMDENDKMAGAKDAARAFVDQMRAGDQTAIIAFSNEPELIEPFTTDKDLLDRSIRKIRPDGSTALYDSIIAGVNQLKGVGGRRALLLLTDGRDLIQTGDDTQASSASLDTAIATAVKAGIAVQTIGLGDRAGGERDGIDEGVLQKIAQTTSGEYFYTPSPDQLARLYRQLSAGMQQEYTLTYRSPRPFYDGTRRDIRVSAAGAPAATGGYVEQHLINVRSEPLVGLLLLLPILGALLLPTLGWRRTARTRGPATSGLQSVEIVVAPSAQDSDPQPIEIVVAPTAPDLAKPATPAIGATIMQPASVVVIPSDVARCQTCDAPLLRTGARFCGECGAQQPALPAAAPRRIFCDQCGRPLQNGAHFCAHCGATAPTLPGVGSWEMGVGGQ